MWSRGRRVATSGLRDHTTTQRFQQQDMIDKLAWVHLRDQKILCARSKGNDTYYFPGGKREAGESDHAALLREIKEELNVDLHPETLTYLGQEETV